jgi:hypothetical protein
MGRPRKPLKLHVLEGTGRKQRLEARAGELQLAPGNVGEPPEWFTPEALAVWQWWTSDPEYSALVARVHRDALVHYCHLQGAFERGCKGLNDGISASDQQTLNSLRMQFGGSPASQSKVKAPGRKDETLSPFELLKQA